MDGPGPDIITRDPGTARPSAPAGDRSPGGRPSFRVDPGHDRSRLDRAGRLWWNHSRCRWSTATDEAGASWSGEPAPGCLVAPTRRDASALAHLVNWVAAGGAGAIPARVVEGGTRDDLVRLDPAESGLGGYALVVGEPGDGAGGDLPLGLRPALVERASLRPGADWWAGDLRATSGRYRFRAFHRGAFRAEVALAAMGEDLVLPSLAALAVGVRLGLAAGEVGDLLAECPAAPRRFEPRGSYRGATLVDDAAEGAGGVAGALALARAAFGRRTIRAVFLPRDEGAAGEPSAADFGAADHAILVARGGSCPEPARLLAASLRSSGASVVLCSSLSGAIRELDRTLGPGDVILTLGADAVGMIADALLRRLARDPHGG